MKVLVLYESVHHGNTEKVAKAMAKALGAELKKASEADFLEGYDLIGLGSGIYFSRHHKSVIDAVKRLEFRGKDIFIFSTAGYPLLKHIYHLELAQRLKLKGAQVVGDFSCRGFGTYGPYRLIGGLNKGCPGREELEKAKEFGRKVRAEARL